MFICNPRITSIFTQDYLEVSSIKKGYKKLLLFQLILFLILLLNSFVLNILAKYYIVFFLLISVIVFKCFFGLEKDRNRYVKDIIFELLIILMVFFLIYYLSGIFIGFLKTDNYYSYYGIITFIIPIILSTVIKEYFRYNMLKKSEGSKLLLITTFILFTMFDLTNIMTINTYTSIYKVFMFISLTLLPVISNNVVCTYISSRFGYKPNIVWLLILNLYSYLLPIIPNINDYLYSIVFIIFPLFIGYKIHLFVQKDDITDEDNLIRKKKEYIPTIIASIFLIIVIYFTSGYFKYYAITIGSGSMLPNIKVGDVVIIEKANNNYDDLKVGQILAYKHSNVIVVHRIVNILDENGKYYFYTKGDANDNIDNYVIEETDIIGIVNHKVPYIGLPTIWLKEL